ncbi:unnamed protein product [Paramecium pentaurelia]|uniref:Uncharacterized protein n=1 Tax=Paramecium pentaurelia TaxID=43138 RepID=A0A8S1XZV8_9CILI|nr:unnamed protein product [Paramecium pentaurelia]
MSQKHILSQKQLQVYLNNNLKRYSFIQLMQTCYSRQKIFNKIKQFLNNKSDFNDKECIARHEIQHTNKNAR